MPKRSDQRRRRNKPEVPIESLSGGEPAEWGEPLDAWHPLAAEVYRSVAASPVAKWMTATDVAYAKVVCQVLTDQLNRDGGAVANALSPIFSALNDLLMTEGARRRLRIELARDDDGDEAEVFDIEAVVNQMNAG
ncbi:hypothetical protein CU254_14745 [Amycolatopsis sp. AA4]|nr:hypothetical protein CU254_14745 [Amycolatopsis sp. AA4]